MEKENIVLLIKTGKTLMRLESLLNKDYYIVNSALVGKRTYWILRKMINNDLEEKPQISDIRVIQIKGNDTYVETLNSLKKDGFIIKTAYTNSVMMVKYA